MSTSEKVLSKNKWYIAAFVIGIIAIIFGIIILFVANENSYSTSMSYTQYGADFYTDVEHAAARAANVLKDGYQLVAKTIAAAFILAGGTQICIFGNLLFKKEKLVETLPSDV